MEALLFRQADLIVLKRILAQDLGFVWLVFQRVFGGGGLKPERGLSTIRRGSQTFLMLNRAHRFLLPPIPYLFLRLKVSIPGVARVPITGIVFHGDFFSSRLPPAQGLIEKTYALAKTPVELHAARIRF
jgi:hypothetical protein